MLRAPSREKTLLRTSCLVQIVLMVLPWANRMIPKGKYCSLISSVRYFQLPLRPTGNFRLHSTLVGRKNEQCWKDVWGSTNDPRVDTVDYACILKLFKIQTETHCMVFICLQRIWHCWSLVRKNNALCWSSCHYVACIQDGFLRYMKKRFVGFQNSYVYLRAMQIK